MKLNTTTNQVEALHKSYTARMPKDVFIKNVNSYDALACVTNIIANHSMSTMIDLLECLDIPKEI